MGFDSKANWVEAILKTDLVLALAAFLRAALAPCVAAYSQSRAMDRTAALPMLNDC
jgi:hypothetical protein